MIRSLICLSFTLYGLAGCPTDLVSADGATEKSATFTRGNQHLYNAENQEAVVDFDTYILLDPNGAIGYWKKVMATYFFFESQQKRLLPFLEPDQYEKIVAAANSGIARAKADIRKGSCVDYNRSIIASILGLRALFEAKNDPGKPTWMTVDSTLAEGMKFAKLSRQGDAEFFLGTLKYELGIAGGRGPAVWLSSGLPRNRLRRKALAFELSAKGESPFVEDSTLFVFEAEQNRGRRDRYTQTALKQIVSDWLPKYPRNQSMLAFKASHKF